VNSLFRVLWYRYILSKYGDCDLLLWSNGGAHEVYIDGATEFYRGLEIREVWSTAFTTTSGHSDALIERLLERNSQLKWGQWYIKGKRAGFRVLLAADANPESLRTAVELIAMEKEKILKEFR